MVRNRLAKSWKKVPKPIKKLIKKSGLSNLLSFFFSKREMELAFQTGWVGKFKKNKEKVREYWRKYRYLDKIKEVCKFSQNSKVLDVGCGISTVLHYLKGNKTGIDPLAEEYKKIYDYPDDLRIIKGRGENLPFKENHFDIILCSNALDHMKSPGKAIKEIKRVLKPEGYFILTLEIFKKNRNKDPAHPHTFTEKEVMALLNGFNILFKKKSPWVGLKRYIEGEYNPKTKELILLLKPKSTLG